MTSMSYVHGFFNDEDNSEIYTYWHTRCLHDALPILAESAPRSRARAPGPLTLMNAALRAAPPPVRDGGRIGRVAPDEGAPQLHRPPLPPDRKSTRLNSSH